MLAGSVAVLPNDLTRSVDAARNRAARGQGIIEREVDTAAQEETVVAAGVGVIPDDLARGVDAVRNRG